MRLAFIRKITLRIYFTLGISLTFLAPLFFGEQASAYGGCRKVFISNSRSYVRASQELKRYLESWLEYQKSDANYKNRWLYNSQGKPLYSPIIFKGKAYHFKAVLGTGLEGGVYLLENNKGQNIVIKKFLQGDRDQNLKDLEHYRQSGVPTIKILALHKKDAFIAEFVPGLSLNFIEDAPPNQISKASQRLIAEEALKLGKGQRWFDRTNTLVYVEAGEIKIKLIDPPDR